jgi:hypothetical protein
MGNRLQAFWALIVALQVPIGLLLFVLIVSTDAYVTRMADGQYTPDSLTEALYFSVQTVTTVGYGNWQAGLKDKDPRVMATKVIAIPAMLGGAFTFTLIISALTAYYVKRAGL